MRPDTTHARPASTRAAPAPGAYIRLQRRCAACAASSGHCAACDDNKGSGVMARLEVGASDDAFEREADRVAAQVVGTGPAGAAGAAGQEPVTVQRAPAPGAAEGGAGAAASRATRAAPAVVHDVLRSPGEALDAPSRQFFERRFGHDFGHVRVHRDAQAQRSAQAVAARAYTVGEHLVFNAGHYAPDSRAGRELLAHELTHVLQQRGTLQRAALSPAFDEDEEQAGAVQPLQRSPLRVQRDALSDDPLAGGDWPEKEEARCIAAVAPDPAECEPARALTWADFTATPPARSRFGAETASDLRERSINSAALQCSPGAAVPSRGVQAFFDGGSSWVKAASRNAGDPALNGCATTVGNCERHFDQHAAAGHVGVDYSIGPAPGGACPAGVSPASTTVTSRADCAATIGPVCTAARVAESARLLRHEQGHFDLSCAMARKANAMLAGTPDFDNLLRGARAALGTAQSAYDTQSHHGCIASAQASWEADIAAGLPAITITPRAAARRRGRR